MENVERNLHDQTLRLRLVPFRSQTRVHHGWLPKPASLLFAHGGPPGPCYGSAWVPSAEPVTKVITFPSTHIVRATLKQDSRKANTISQRRGVLNGPSWSTT